MISVREVQSNEKKLINEIRFVVIGDGAAKVEVEKRIEAEKITNG